MACADCRGSHGWVEEVREALETDTSMRAELADVAREADFDPAELGL